MTRSNSRYRNFKQPIYIRYYHFEKILPLVGWFDYVVKQGDKIEHLATLNLGDPALYWIILGCNKILDPFFGLTEGLEIRIPNKAIIDEVLK